MPTQEASPQPEVDERVQAVVDARRAAWQAEIDSYSNPRSPDNPALFETMTSRKLLHDVFSILLNNIVDHVYEDWNLDIQSVVFAEDDVAWLETCVSYHWKQVRPDSGEVLEGSVESLNPGYRTQQLTEEMWLTDDGWKLALSIPNFFIRDDDDVGNCPIDDDTQFRLSDDEVASVRGDAEEQYVDALINGSHEDLSLYSGTIADAITDWGTGSAHFFRHYCPSFPSFLADQRNDRQTLDDLPDFYDAAWHSLYEDSWKEMTARSSTNDPSSMPCSYPYRIAHNPIPNAADHPANANRFDKTTSSKVTVDDIVWSDTLPVAYFDTCRVVHFSDSSYGTTDPSWGPNDAIIRSTESMRMEDGNWALAARWNIDVSEDTSSGCE